MRYSLSLIFLLLSLATHAQHISYQHYTLEDGLPGLQITAMLQAQDGRLWIGTKSGLSVFDGTSFKNFSEKDGLGSTKINDIVELKGKIVVLSNVSIDIINEGKLNSYALKKYTTGKNQGFKIHNTLLFLDENLNTVLFSTVNREDIYNVRFNHYSFNVENNEIQQLSIPPYYFIAKTNDGELLMTNYSAKKKNGRWGRTSYLYDLQHNKMVQFDSLMNIYTEIDSTLYLGMQLQDKNRYIYMYKYINDSIKNEINLGEFNDFIRTKLLKNCWIFLSNGVTSRVELISNDLKTRKQYEFPKIQAHEIIQDMEGNIWIGSETGLYKIPKNPFYHFDATHNLPKGNLWAFHKTNNTLLVSAYGSGVYIADTTQQPVRFNRIPEKAFPQNWRYTGYFYFGVRKYDNDKLVFPTGWGSLVYKDAKWSTLENQTLRKNYTTALCSYVDEEKKEVAEVGLMGINFFDYAQNLQLNVPKSRFWNKNVFDMERINEDTYFVALGSRQALYNRKTDEITPLHLTYPNNSNDTLTVGFMTLAKDPQGGIWCGSLAGEAGLYLYKEGTFKKVAAHVLDGIVETVAVVNEGRILLASSTNEGLLAIHLERFYLYQAAEDKSKVANPFYWFDDSNGFTYKQEPQQNSLVADGENRVMFTTGEAKAYYFDIDTTIFNIPQLSPYIYSVEGFNSDSLTWTTLAGSYQTGDTLRFSTEERAIRFEPHCITHNAPEQIRYAYRLKQGNSWTNWKTSEETKLLVTNLRAGFNQVEVKGFYKFQTPAMQPLANRFVVYVQPLWFETAWGKGALGMLTLLTLSAVFFMSDRRRKRKERERQAMENWRIKAERMEEIEEQLSTIKQQEQGRLQLQEELNQYNEELQATAEQIREWDIAIKEGRVPETSLEVLQKYKNLPDYNQVMGIVKMAGKLTEQLSAQIKSDKKRREELEIAQIKLVAEDGPSELKRIFMEQHPGVFQRLQKQYPYLTQRETELFMLIRLGKNNAEIAESMGIERESVKTSRKRLKKKLQLSTEIDLTTWVMEF